MFCPLGLLILRKPSGQKYIGNKTIWHRPPKRVIRQRKFRLLAAILAP